MSDIQTKKQDRLKFLHLIYTSVKGRRGFVVDGFEVGQELGFNREYSNDLYYYLIEEGLIEPMGAGLRLSISHAGIIEVERALSEPNESTTYFPPAFNIIQINQMNGGAIQQGSHNSSIQVISKDTVTNIGNYLKDLGSFVNEQVDDKTLSEEILAEINTIKEQLNSPKPKNTILLPILQSIKEILIGATASVISVLAMPTVQELIQQTEKLISELLK